MELVIDPVCDMEFDKSAAAAWSVHQERDYYFCHPVCKKIFDADPTRFVHAEASEASGPFRPDRDKREDRRNSKPDCEWTSSWHSAKP